MDEHERNLMIELLDITDILEDSKVVFSNRAKEIIKELSEKYEETEVHKKYMENVPDWIKDASAAEVYCYMCSSIAKAPTGLHVLMIGPILIPVLWKKIQEAEQKLKEFGMEAGQEAGEMGLAYATP